MRAGYSLDALGVGGREAPQVALGPGLTKKTRQGETGLELKVGGRNEESFGGFNLTWLMAFVGYEALRLTRVAESAA